MKDWCQGRVGCILAGLLLGTTPPHALAADKVALPGFAIDRTEVSIAQFDRFVRATGTVTRAEKEGGGFEYGAGWERRPGWSWRKPDGVDARPDLPAVHLDFAEAQAYCRWAGGRLPTGAEWQQAGFTELRDAPPAPWVKGRTYPWTTGDSSQGANTSDADPWPRAAPAGATRQGVNGLYDMGANVWEWTTDWYQEHKEIPQSCCASFNPRGGERDKSYDLHMTDIKIARALNNFWTDIFIQFKSS